jgi:cytidine deaminase
MRPRVDTLTDLDKERLVKAAMDVRRYAYAPYSGYKVGAAVRVRGGAVYSGCNVENAVHTPAVCAERNAVFKAISEGKRKFVAIAVATSNGAFPCGVCRQVLREFCRDLVILVADHRGRRVETSLARLLPQSFGPESVSGRVGGKARLPRQSRT